MNTDVLIFSMLFIVSTSLIGMAICRILGGSTSRNPGSILPYTDISTPMPTVKTPKNSGPNVPIPERPSPNDTRLF